MRFIFIFCVWVLHTCMSVHPFLSGQQKVLEKFELLLWVLIIKPRSWKRTQCSKYTVFCLMCVSVEARKGWHPLEQELRCLWATMWVLIIDLGLLDALSFPKKKISFIITIKNSSSNEGYIAFNSQILLEWKCLTYKKFGS